MMGYLRRSANRELPNSVYLVPYKPGDLSSLPYKTVRYVLSSLWLSTNCRMPDSASRFYADPYKPEIKPNQSNPGQAFDLAILKSWPRDHPTIQQWRATETRKSQV